MLNDLFNLCSVLFSNVFDGYYCTCWRHMDDLLGVSILSLHYLYLSMRARTGNNLTVFWRFTLLN